MAELKRKFIRYPNEREAWGVYGYASEESLKNTIRDIHTFFTIDLGLTQSPDTGQLDLANIPDVGMKAIYDASTTGRWSRWSYGYTVYEFTDPLQNDFPIYIKLEFQVIDGSYGNQDYKSRTYLNVRTSIMSATDGAGQPIGGRMNIVYEQFPALCHSSYNHDVFENNISDSYGFYDKDNGRLYVCVCPGIMKGTFNHSTIQPQMNFYIERSKNALNNVTNDYIQVQNFQRGVIDDPNQMRQFNMLYSTKELLNYQSNAGSHVPMEGIQGNTATRSNLFRTISVNPLTNELLPNSNVISYLNKDIPLSGIIVDVKLSDSEVGKYVTVSPSTCGVYVWSSNYGHLIRVE